MKIPEALFHYTVGPKLERIARSKHLMPAGYGLATSKKEKPVLWFSENPQWEPTTTKVMSLDSGKTFVRPTLPMLQQTIGIYRFRLDTRKPEALNAAGIKLLPWSRIQVAARIDAKDITLMVKAGMHLGATPTHWWGVMEPVPLSLEVSGVLRLETRVKAEAGGRESWEPVDMAEALAAYQALRLRVKQSLASETPGAMGL